MNSLTVAEYLALPYSRAIVPDGAGRYSAEIAEFPGCFAEGDTPDEAYRNLESVAESWLESALAQGLHVPTPTASHGYSGTVSLRLPKTLHRSAAELAQREGVSLNQLIVSSLAARVGSGQMAETIGARVDVLLSRLEKRFFVFHLADRAPIAEPNLNVLWASQFIGAAGTPSTRTTPWEHMKLAEGIAEGSVLWQNPTATPSLTRS